MQDVVSDNESILLSKLVGFELLSFSVSVVKNLKLSQTLCTYSTFPELNQRE